MDLVKIAWKFWKNDGSSSQIQFRFHPFHRSADSFPDLCETSVYLPSGSRFRLDQRRT